MAKAVWTEEMAKVGMVCPQSIRAAINNDKNPSRCFCLGRACGAWRWLDDGHHPPAAGYCGVGGPP